MAAIKPIGTYQPFADWTTEAQDGSPWSPQVGADPALAPAPNGLVANPDPGSMSSGVQPVAPSPSTDYSGLASAGIGAAGGAVGGIAQAAANQAAIQAQAAQSAAGNQLSEKLAKMQLSQSADQFGKNQQLQALMWAMGAGKSANNTASASRDVRRQDTELLSDVLARIYMPKR